MSRILFKIIFWSPRILGILYILLLMIFSLDIFQPGQSFSQTAVGLLIHNIPALLLLLLLIISFKYEILGGFTFILAGLIYPVMLLIGSDFKWRMASWIAVISIPAFLTGILFIISWKRNQDRKINI